MKALRLSLAIYKAFVAKLNHGYKTSLSNKKTVTKLDLFGYKTIYI